jgi:hypothetical protein
MQTRVERLRLGEYRLSRQLAKSAIAERWLAVHEADQSLHIAYRFKTADEATETSIRECTARISAVGNTHLLPCEAIFGGIGGSVWVVCPFTGNHDGLVSLASLLKAKGGRMTPLEADRTLTQLLEAIAAAHADGCHHGHIRMDEIVVDRRGSLAIELYGLRRRLGTLWSRTAGEVAKDEVRSIVEIGYTLITGLSAEEPRILASRLFPKLDRRWDDWFEEGMDPLGGFASADEALASLPSLRREVEERQKASPVQTVIRRFRQVIGP